MNETAIPAEVLNRLPDWQGALANTLDGGLSNHTWLLEKDGRRAVLKFDHETRAAPYNKREDEARVQSAAARADLANRVLYVDDRVLLSEYSEGTVWTPSSLEVEPNLERLALALRRMHVLPRTKRSFDAATAARIYANNIDRDPELVALCAKTIAECGVPEQICCCHNDLVAENIIATPVIRFLDWEYACDNDPLFDLATIVEHHDLSQQLAAHLLDAYYDGDGERQRSGLIAQQRLYRALLWLWLASRPGSSETDIERAAERLTTSDS